MRPSLETGLIISDTHRPYHDHKAWALMLKVARILKPKHLYIIGDFADCYTVSSHSKDPRRALRMVEEMANVREGLDELDSLKATHKTYVAGNHSDRLERYLRDRAPELFEFIDIPQLLQLKQRGWKYVPYKSDTKLGKMYFTHDVGGSTTGRAAVYRCLDTYHHSIITGHTHRMAYVVEGNAAGECKLSAQFGWLGDVSQVDYMHNAVAKKNWALGFGVFHYEPKSGLVYVTPVPIVNYTCCVNGRLYKA